MHTYIAIIITLAALTIAHITLINCPIGSAALSWHELIFLFTVARHLITDGTNWLKVRVRVQTIGIGAEVYTREESLQQSTL